MLEHLLVSVPGLWFRVIILGRVHVYQVVSWDSGLLHIHVLCLRLPDCAGAVRVAALADYIFLRCCRRCPRFLHWSRRCNRCPRFFHWSQCTVWWCRSYWYSLVRPVRNPDLHVLSDVFIVPSRWFAFVGPEVRTQVINALVRSIFGI